MTVMEGRGFYYPVDTAVGQDSRLYVVNRSLDNVTRGVRVTMCDIDSGYYGNFGSFGNKEGQFEWPSGGAIDSRGRVYISDEQLDRISVFDSLGRVPVPVGRTRFRRRRIWIPHPASPSMIRTTFTSRTPTTIGYRNSPQMAASY